MMRTIGFSLLLWLSVPCLLGAQDGLFTENLFVVTIDGLRWQELFTGADSALLFDHKYTQDVELQALQFWTPDAEERRQLLFPFVWSTLADEGQIYGNRNLGNLGTVTNGKWCSYPGYNEMFTGAPDDRNIKGNKKVWNPNTNVFEFLNQQEGFNGGVAAFASWDAFPFILHEKRSNFPVFSDKEILNFFETNELKNVDKKFIDRFTWTAMESYVKTNHPRVVFVGLGDTDEYAHDGRYDDYLNAARETDARIAALWKFIENDPQYRNKTTLIITTDHGRGYRTKKAWRKHNSRVEGSDEVWFAVIGPDTKPLGEVSTPMQWFQKQLAQTMASVLGFSFFCEHTVASAVQTVFQPSEQREWTTTSKK